MRVTTYLYYKSNILYILSKKQQTFNKNKMDIWDLKKEASDIKEEFRLTNNETVFKTKADQFIKKMNSNHVALSVIK